MTLKFNLVKIVMAQINYYQIISKHKGNEYKKVQKYLQRNTVIQTQNIQQFISPHVKSEKDYYC